ncbi:N-myc-interactor isoform X2 [Xenopus laevis]|uniref:N-myc-interactor isoform X2 n=1 Tax=Xenopus laevis TaxID=8355 RepID=A0A8J0U0H0_XENLA|nr:N-myc-interactor isoform X2 [Xenopus laevis]
MDTSLDCSGNHLREDLCNSEIVRTMDTSLDCSGNHLREDLCNSESPNTDKENREGLLAEYNHWKKQQDTADHRKSFFLVEKLDATDTKMELQRLLEELSTKQENMAEEKLDKSNQFKRESEKLKMVNLELQKQIQELKKTLKKEEHVLEDMKKELQVENKLPRKNINFKSGEAHEDAESFPDISYKYFVTINGGAILQSGQTFVTFEDSEVAKTIIKKGNYKLDFEGTSVKVTAKPINFNRTTQFEINMNLSKKRLCVHYLPVELSDEYLRDRLELTFYKPSIGGGEIEGVQFDRSRNLAFIDFRQSGVVERLVKQKHFEFSADNALHQITVEPHLDIKLNKLQMFTGKSLKSVLLDGLKGVEETEDDIQDIVQIFFQKTTNGGGEVEHILHSHNRKRVAEFEPDLN